MSEDMKIIVRTPEELLGTLNDVEAKNAPPELFLLGDETLLRHAPRVSIVGSRKASRAGFDRAAAYVRDFVRSGAVIVSGLAEGIDTAAHETAMEAGGRTIAVLGTALDTVYPPENRPLQARIAREHLLVSQFPVGVPIRKANFPMRNRTMALLTDATVIVEAGSGSGSWHQGWEALRLNRMLVLDESIDLSLRTPADLLKYGAQVFAPADAEIISDELPRLSSAEDISF